MSIKELKIIIKFNVNFRSTVIKYTFPSQSLFFGRRVDFTISPYNKNVGSPFSVKSSFQNQFRGSFP